MTKTLQGVLLFGVVTVPLLYLGPYHTILSFGISLHCVTNIQYFTCFKCLIEDDQNQAIKCSMIGLA